MARPIGKFARQSNRLLEQLRYLGVNKTNSELAKDLEVSPSQISNYLRYLKKSGAIEIKVDRWSFHGKVISRRSIKVLK